MEKIKKEYDVLHDFANNAEYLNSNYKYELPFKVENAIKLENQGQFNPYMYCLEGNLLILNFSC
jgi:hypothetical protein